MCLERRDDRALGSAGATAHERLAGAKSRSAVQATLRRISSCCLLQPVLRALHAPVPQWMSRPAIQPDLQQIVERLPRRGRPRRKVLRVAHRAARRFQTIIHFRDHGRRMCRSGHVRTIMNAAMGFAIEGNAPQYGIVATGTSATPQRNASALTVAVDRARRTRSARKRSVPTFDAVQLAPSRGALVVPSLRRPVYRSRPSRVYRRSARRANPEFQPVSLAVEQLCAGETEPIPQGRSRSGNGPTPPTTTNSTPASARHTIGRSTKLCIGQGFLDKEAPALVFAPVVSLGIRWLPRAVNVEYVESSHSACAKNLAQTAAPFLIPLESLESVFPCLGEKNDATHGSPLVISAYTSSHATPTGPSRSSRARRRSSSARSAGVSVRSSEERLRQRSSIKSYFSSAESFERSSAGLPMHSFYQHPRRSARLGGRRPTCQADAASHSINARISSNTWLLPLLSAPSYSAELAPAQTSRLVGRVSTGGQRGWETEIARAAERQIQRRCAAPSAAICS